MEGRKGKESGSLLAQDGNSHSQDKQYCGHLPLQSSHVGTWRRRRRRRRRRRKPQQHVLAHPLLHSLLPTVLTEHVLTGHQGLLGDGQVTDTTLLPSSSSSSTQLGKGVIQVVYTKDGGHLDTSLLTGLSWVPHPCIQQLLLGPT